MKNSNLRNLVNKSGITPIQGEMLKSIKGGTVALAPSCPIKGCHLCIVEE